MISLLFHFEISTQNFHYVEITAAKYDIEIIIQSNRHHGRKLEIGFWREYYEVMLKFR